MSGLNVKLQNGGTVNINTGEHIDNIKKHITQQFKTSEASMIRKNSKKILKQKKLICMK